MEIVVVGIIKCRNRMGWRALFLHREILYPKERVSEQAMRWASYLELGEQKPRAQGHGWNVSDFTAMHGVV